MVFLNNGAKPEAKLEMKKDSKSIHIVTRDLGTFMNAVNVGAADIQSLALTTVGSERLEDACKLIAYTLFRSIRTMAPNLPTSEVLESCKDHFDEVHPYDALFDIALERIKSLEEEDE